MAAKIQARTPDPRMMWSAGQHRVSRALDTVSTRMILIILLSSAPIAVLSGAISWHSYEAASDASAARAGSLVNMLRGRTQGSLAASRDFLQNVASLDALRDPSRCEPALHLALVTQRQRYDGLAELDAAGHVVCVSGSMPSEPLAETSEGFEVQHLALLERPRRLVATLAWREPHAPARTLLAAMPLGWDGRTLFGADGRSGILGSSQRMRAWLVGPDGLAAPVCRDCDWPVPPDLEHLVRLASAGQGEAVSTPSGSAAYGVLSAPISLLTLTRPTDAEVHALTLFIIRVIGIVLLLGIGLLGVAVGANMLVVAPLQSLTRAVTHWRQAGDYDPGEGRMMPAELRELSRVFHQATRSLSRHEHELREAEARQELLIKEIHHRVKNNLQIIASLLNLQANRIRQPEARAEFASARDRVRALATLHRYLYSEGDLQTLNMRSFLQELCAQLFQAIGEKQGRRIQLHIEAPEIAMATDQAVPLALVVTEAVSNAIKYAFPDGRSGHVRVVLSELGEGMGRLLLEDDGVGIPAGRAETETGIRDGLGIQLIRGFSRQLGAQLDVHEGGGTRYTLTFPLHPKEADIGEEDGEAGDDARDG